MIDWPAWWPDLPDLTDAAKAGLASVVFALGVGIVMFIARRRRLASEGTEEAAETDQELLLDSLAANGGDDTLRVKGDMVVRRELAFDAGFVIEGSLVLADGAMLDAPLEVFGKLTLGTGARLLQPIVVHGDALLGRDARAGPTQVDGDVRLEPGAAVLGPLRCAALYLFEDESEARAIATAPLVKLEGT